MSRRHRGILDKDTRKLVEVAERSGCQVRRAGSGHWIITAPNGSFVASVGSTPSDVRAVRNLSALLARAGVGT